MTRTWPHAIRLVAALLALGGLLQADLDKVKRESDPGKRSRLAVEHADKMLGAARDAWRTGDAEKVRSSLDEVREAVQLAYDTLDDAGWNARKKANPFKRVEIGTRNLLRRLESFRIDMGFDEREQLDEVIEAVREVNKQTLRQIMGGR